uniref:agamous-like MADS-box protein AGL62 n=1 Tax=Erigeron canadensis TaxID=72917 RepID=UPI001CB92936|nr:agamous-like MADS-box protein AGL62 [Erigeron canadensis]
MAKKPSLGRQKIKIAKIQIKNHLQVTFSKRRSGLFKKASELCTLCGVEIAIVVFSPAGKVFSFGHPKVESIVDRFLTRNPNFNSTTNSLYFMEAHRIASIPELNMQLTHIHNELEAEKKRTETLDEMRKASRSQFWWEAPIEELNLHELEQLKDSMEELKKNVTIQANKLYAENSNSMSLFGTNNNNSIISGGFDHYEMKPGPVLSTSSGVCNTHHGYGYGHSLF